ncbi:MAG: LPS-assembly protein LptD [Bdellovibrio sp.]|nr:LPS-assembly protein LptD [Bdellovibrio sp.]
MHWSGDKTIWDRDGKRVELVGNAQLHQPGETIIADYIVFDKETSNLDAKGSCIYVSPELIIYGDEMHFNMNTRMGSIVNGRVSNNRYSLTGERINKLGPGRFQVHNGDYSTCNDCPKAWALSGGDVELEFEGYAYMKDVTGKIKDVPVFWFPYFIVPLKKSRQTGFLIPKIKIATEGVRVILPFFWAIHNSADMKIVLAYWGGFGPRFEWEGRYKLTKRSEGKADFFYVKDPTFEKFIEDSNKSKNRNDTAISDRWGFMLEQAQELPFGIDQKLKLYEVRDNYFPNRFSDIPSDGASLTSSLFLSYTKPALSAYVAARRTRNLLNSDPYNFDSKTVQVYPTAVVTTNDKFIVSNYLASGISVGITNFTRTFGDFDLDPLTTVRPNLDPIAGKDPLRRATRLSITPTLYTTLRPFDYFSLVPSLEYRTFFYSFHNAVPNLSRGYLLFRSELSTQFERIYDTSNPAVPKIKHLIRPFLTFNLIPHSFENPVSHPFLEQISHAQAQGLSGYHFDSYDIVPIDSSQNYNTYFDPLGKSLTYAVNSQILRRVGDINNLSPTYHKMIDFKAGQTINFREYRKTPDDRKPLSRFFSGLGFNYNQWTIGSEYYYLPYGNISLLDSRHNFSLSVKYVLESGTRQDFLSFDRSLSLNYIYFKSGGETNYLNGSFAYSISDYFLPSFSFSYTLVKPSHLLGMGLGLKIQTPSKCWRIDLAYSLSLCPESTVAQSKYCSLFDPGLTINLTGEGFSGISSVVSTVLE